MLKQIAVEFRSFVLDLARECKFTEIVAPLSSLAETPAAAGLLWCLEKHDCTLLVDDGRLFQWCLGDTSARMKMLDNYLQVGLVL